MCFSPANQYRKIIFHGRGDFFVRAQKLHPERVCLTEYEMSFGQKRVTGFFQFSKFYRFGRRPKTVAGRPLLPVRRGEGARSGAGLR